MSRTYDAIGSVTTTAALTTEVVFSSVPSNYTDLVVTASSRTNESAVTSGLLLRLNGVSTTGVYSVTRLQGNGSSASSGRDTAASETQSNGGLAAGGNSAAGIYAVTTAHIMSYSNTNMFKTVLWHGGHPPALLRVAVSLVQITAAITTVRLGGDFVAGSTFQLFGIRAES